jgi:GT2 family glycosyltransferase
MLREKFPKVKIISNSENLGFAKANNQGIKAARGENILLLNSDTVVLDDCLLKTAEFVKSRPDAGIIGCKVLNKDRTLQYSCWHTPTVLTEALVFTKNVIKNFWDPLTHFKIMKYWDHASVKEVNCLSGCFFWVKKDCFERFGNLDEGFFMYYEDFEFCRRIKKSSDYKIYYYPEARIVHLGTMSADPENFSMIKNCYKSAGYYFNRCFGKNEELFFLFLCKSIWYFEMFVFALLRFDKRCNKKLGMLKSLLSL